MYIGLVISSDGFRHRTPIRRKSNCRHFFLKNTGLISTLTWLGSGRFFVTPKNHFAPNALLNFYALLRLLNKIHYNGEHSIRSFYFMCFFKEFLFFVNNTPEKVCLLFLLMKKYVLKRFIKCQQLHMFLIF